MASKKHQCDAFDPHVLCSPACQYCTFALVYLFFSDGGRCISKVESFYHALWFSVHTSSTIGYGHMAPNPDCVGANLVTMGQTLCTILLQATLLGVMFSRFRCEKGARRRSSAAGGLSAHVRGPSLISPPPAFLAAPALAARPPSSFRAS